MAACRLRVDTVAGGDGYVDQSKQPHTLSSAITGRVLAIAHRLGSVLCRPQFFIRISICRLKKPIYRFSQWVPMFDVKYSLVLTYLYVAVVDVIRSARWIQLLLYTLMTSTT